MDIFQKVIEITKVVNGQNFEIKTSNILKGEEPEKTNKFLQAFYLAATSGKDFSKIISKFLDYKKNKEEEKKKQSQQGDDKGAEKASEKVAEKASEKVAEKSGGAARKEAISKDTASKEASTKEPINKEQAANKEKSKPTPKEAASTNSATNNGNGQPEPKKNITQNRPQTPSKKPNSLPSETKEIIEDKTKKVVEKVPQGLISDKNKEEQKINTTNNSNNSNIKPSSTSASKPQVKNKDDELTSNQSNAGKIKIESRIGKFADITGGENTKQTATKSFNIADIESIKNYVQEISKNSNPIGKIIDFLGDDIESMNKELQSWMKESKNYKERFEEEVK
jgi:TRAF3-interacting protein 1